MDSVLIEYNNNLMVSLVPGLTLKGAGAGLAHMFFPKLELLLKPTVWLDAATQVNILQVKL